MNGFFTTLKWVILGFACVSLASCAGETAGERMADMPQWLGGEPPNVPPRRGTPQYDAWMAARAQEAARPKTDQKTDQKIDQKIDQKTDQPKDTDQPDKTDQPK